ncbi:hypothetical protein BKI52_17290 [marine bacterium AO1-C]|nr:hypothetical protein BKI52_17290 [marine bacterium AO1-C]
MEQYRELLLVLSSLGVLESLFFGVYLLTIKGEKRVPNLLLSVLIFALAIRIGKSILFVFTSDLPEVVKNIGLGAKTAIGPALYLHIKAFSDYKNFRFHKSYLLHFLPFFIYITAAPYVSNKTAFEPYIFILIQFFIYLILSSLVWYRSRATIENSYEIIWMRNLIAGIFLIWLAYTLYFVHIIPIYMTGAILYSFVVYGMIYLALKRNSIFVVAPEVKKYQGSKIQPTQSSQLLQQVLQLFETEKPYLDANLTLSKAAQMLNIAPRVLSQVINEQREQNFSDFINAYRIQQAQALLHSSTHRQQTIASIAYESGFHSLSAFNTAFKKNTGTTPSAYRKLKLQKDMT